MTILISIEKHQSPKSDIDPILFPLKLRQYKNKATDKFIKKKRHNLLSLPLTQVVFFCMMMYSLPSMWGWYETVLYPQAAPVLLPLVQIALMSSVYCTVILSWERYVRICLVSNNLVSGNDYFSKGKFRLYMAIIMAFPVVFYAPKFFEVREVWVLIIIAFFL